MRIHVALPALESGAKDSHVDFDTVEGSAVYGDEIFLT
jgi:hypothetical protein